VRPFRGDHFAVFPPELIETPIKAGCPADGVVLDPFMGSGTTALVARRLGRNFLGIELNPRYIRLARQRLALAA
jgi:DNA modification methylase